MRMHPALPALLIIRQNKRFAPHRKEPPPVPAWRFDKRFGGAHAYHAMQDNMDTQVCQRLFCYANPQEL